MGLLSYIEGADTRFRIRNVTWDLLDCPELQSYVFNDDNRLFKIVRGHSSIIGYNFITDSATLIIYESGADGVSYHVSYVGRTALVLCNESTGKFSCFANRASKNPPLDSQTAFLSCFKKRVKYLNEFFSWCSNRISFTDKAVEGLNTLEMLCAIDTFRRYVPGYEEEYIEYKNSTNRPDSNALAKYMELKENPVPHLG